MRKSIEDEIEELVELDALRARSERLRDQGRNALREIKEGWYSPPSPNPYEHPILVKALSNQDDEALRWRVGKLDGPTAAEILGAQHLRQPKEIPIFRAARSMQALAASPTSTFSEALLVHYYDIIREIYTADAPDWRIGGARAGRGGVASAYVTGECVRAILGFARTLNNTGRLIENLSSARKRREQMKREIIPEAWREAELVRVDRCFYNCAAQVIGNIALQLDLEDTPDNRLLPLTPDSQRIERFLKEAPARISRSVEKTVKTFQTVIAAIQADRQEERRRAEKEDWDQQRESEQRRSRCSKRFERSESGHAVALAAIQHGLESAQRAVKLLSLPGRDMNEKLDSLAQIFFEVAEAVRKLTRPSRTFLSTVLDRELTAASSEARPGWDPAELAFAAASYGFAARNAEDDRLQDDRLQKAVLHLSQAMSARGRYPGGAPFFYELGGNHVEVTGAEVLRAFAQLLEHVEGMVDVSLVRRMLHFFDDTARSFPGQPHCRGWSLENDPELSRPILWVTGLSVLALDKINRMLDARINRQVFRHFSVKRNDDLEVPLLHKLFYPDIGLRADQTRPRLKPTAGVGEEAGPGEEAIALTLERMRAHVLGIGA